MKSFKQIVAIASAIAMVITGLPITASAEEAPPECEFLQAFENTSVFTAPKDELYQGFAIGKGGDGGGAGQASEPWPFPPGINYPGDYTKWPVDTTSNPYVVDKTMSNANMDWSKYGKVTVISSTVTQPNGWMQENAATLKKIEIPGAPERSIYELSANGDFYFITGDDGDVSTSGTARGHCTIFKDTEKIAFADEVYVARMPGSRYGHTYISGPANILFEPVTPGTYTLLMEGKYSASDSTRLEYTLVVDPPKPPNRPPMTTYTPIPEGWAKFKETTVTLSDPDGDPLMYSLGAGGPKPYTEPFRVVIRSESNVGVWVTDPSGLGDLLTLRVTQVDPIAPIIKEMSLTELPSKLRSLASNKQLQPDAYADDYESGSGVVLYEYQIVPEGQAAKDWIGWKPDEVAPPITEAFKGVVRFRATDLVGNVSTVKTYAQDVILESIPPTAVAELSTKTSTSKEVTIQVTATDEKNGSGVYTVQIGSDITYGATAVAQVTENGVYPVTVLDQAGNEYAFEVTVDNIDKASEYPKVELEYNKDWTKDNVKIHATATDDKSGIASIKLPNGSIRINPSNSMTYSTEWDATKNGIYKCSVIDAAGNSNESEFTIDSIDRTQPTITQLNLNATSDELLRSRSAIFTKQVEVEVEASDTKSGVRMIEYKLVPLNSKPEDLAWKEYDPASKPKIAKDWKGIVTARCTDKVGNISETREYTDTVIVDGTPPEMSYVSAPVEWTNKEVTIQVTSKDDGSGTKEITLPSGVTVGKPVAELEVQDNGVYKFQATNLAGLSSTLEVTVGNIDKIPPSVTKIELKEKIATGVFSKIRSALTGREIEIVAEATDTESGLDRIEYQPVNKGAIEEPDNWRVWVAGARLKEDLNGTLHVRAIDKVGNISAVVQKVVVVDSESPLATHKFSPTGWTNENVTINVTATDSAGIKQITDPDGKVTMGNTANYKVPRNGEYKFTLEDNAGNISGYTAIVYNIEKYTPTPPKTEVGGSNPEKPGVITPEMYKGENKEYGWKNTATNIEVKSVAESGIKEYYYKAINESASETGSSKSRSRRSTDADGWVRTTGDIKISDEGISLVKVKSLSNAGNVSPISEYTVKNDYTQPTVTSEVDSSKQIKVRAADSLSGIASIECPHKFHTNVSMVSCYSNTATHPYTVTDTAGNSTTIRMESNKGSNVYKPSEGIATPDIPIKPVAPVKPIVPTVPDGPSGSSAAPKPTVGQIGDDQVTTPKPTVPETRPDKSDRPYKGESSGKSSSSQQAIGQGLHSEIEIELGTGVGEVRSSRPKGGLRPGVNQTAPVTTSTSSTAQSSVQEERTAQITDEKQSSKAVEKKPPELRPEGQSVEEPQKQEVVETTEDTQVTGKNNKEDQTTEETSGVIAWIKSHRWQLIGGVVLTLAPLYLVLILLRRRKEDEELEESIEPADDEDELA